MIVRIHFSNICLAFVSLDHRSGALKQADANRFTVEKDKLNQRGEASRAE